MSNLLYDILVEPVFAILSAQAASIGNLNDSFVKAIYLAAKGKSKLR